MVAQSTLQRPTRVTGGRKSLAAQVKAAATAVKGGFSLPFSSFNWYSAYGGYSAASGGYGNWTSPFRYGANYYAGSDIDWNLEAGPSTQNSIIMSTINFLAVSFQEAPVQVMTKKASGAVDIPDHPLTQLLEDPNPFYDGTVLWMSTVFSWNVAGNAYWIKWRNANDEVVQLWYEPHNTIRPLWSRDDPNTFIIGYEVRRDQRWIPVESRNVVHFRWMQDPDNPRLGMSPLASVLREIFTDKEGAAYTAVVLRNLGWPGYIISPNNQDDDISEDDASRIKSEIEGNFTKDNRGRPMVSPRSVKVDTLGWSPNDLNVRDLRRIPEERITACLRVPAVVVGLGAGLDRNTFNNVSEAREQAYENNLVPTWRIFGRTMTKFFKDDYPDWKTGMYVSFDVTEVRVLQEDYNRKSTTISTLFKANIIMQDEARVATNFDELPDDEGKRFWFQIVATGAGGGGKDPQTGGPPEEAVNAENPPNPQPPPAPKPPTNEQPGTPAPNAAPKNGATNGAKAPQAKDILEAFDVMRRAYPLVYTLDGEHEHENGYGQGSDPFEVKYNENHDAHGRFGSGGGSGHTAPTTLPKGTGKGLIGKEDAAAAKHIGAATGNDAAVAAKQSVVAGVTEQIMKDPEATRLLVGKGNKGQQREATAKYVSQTVGTWAKSSGDNDHQSLAMQRAVAEEFGGQSQWAEMEARLPKATRDLVEQEHQTNGAKRRIIARAMYNHTQETLAKEGVTEVTLHRGMNFSESDAPKWTNYGYRDNIHMQPINSFSSDGEVASRFASLGSSVSRVVTTTVPRERIFSTAKTGFGCLDEREFVVLGTGKTPARITKTEADIGDDFFKAWLPKGFETKYNAAHDAHGKFAAGHHVSTGSPSGSHIALLGTIDKAGNAHITQGKNVGDSAERSNAKSTLVSAVTDRIMASPEAQKALGIPHGKPGYNEALARVTVSTKVNRAVGQWAGNSGDTSTPSLAMQRAVAEEFGSPGAWKEMEDRIPSNIKAEVDSAHKKYGAENRTIARAMYDHTQSELTKAGITEMTLHRGMRFGTSVYGGGAIPKWTNYGYRDNVHLQPISSFATHPGVARSFSSVGEKNSNYGRSVIISTVVPKERIFSTARTGFGCLNEHEVVVLGTGKTPAKIIQVTEENVKKIKKWDD